MSTSMHIQGLLGGMQVDTWISYQMAKAVGGSILLFGQLLVETKKCTGF
jgi:hypothetical protein